MALADALTHVRRLCDKRDENFQVMCPACAQREEVLITIYHEIGHICEDSNKPVTDYEKAKLVRDWLRDNPAAYAARVRTRLESSYLPENYLALAKLVNPYLPAMVNCLEDVRVNRSMTAARPGLRVMFQAECYRIFTQGYEVADPSTGGVRTVMWNENPIESQLLVGLFLEGSGYNYTGWLHPDATKVLADPELATLTRRIRTARSVGATFEVATACLARFVELGYFRTPEDEEDLKEEGSDEPDETEESDVDSDPDESADDSDAESGPSSSSAGEGSDSEGEPQPGESGSSEPDDTAESGSGNAGDDAEVEEQGDDPDMGSEDGEDAGDDDGAEAGSVPESDPGESGDSGDHPSEDEARGGSDDDPEDSDADAGGEEAGGDESDDDSGAGLDDESGDVGSSGEASGDGEASGEGGTDQSDDDSLVGDGDGHESDTHEEGDTDERERADQQPEPGGEGQASDDRPQGQEGADPQSEAEAPAGEDEPLEGEGGGPTEDAESEALEESDELIDTGADDGSGGVEARHGTADEADRALTEWLGHDEDHHPEANTAEEDLAIDRAIIQGAYFETPSSTIYGVREHYWNKPILWEGKIDMSVAWSYKHIQNFRKKLGVRFTNKALGIEGNFDPDESLIGSALLHTRIAFAANKRGHYVRNLKSGKVNTRSLGKRAPVDDPRLFKKKVVPSKRSYFVILGVDISFSQVGENIAMTKSAVMAQAELLHRAGVPFAVYAHTGNFQNPNDLREGMSLDIYHIKDAQEPWTEATRERLRKIAPASANLDGHTLEFYRKRLDEVLATDKIIMYYTDGKMPAENHDEELEILQREIRLCAVKKYTLMGVGIRTDSPVKHGLDTVQIDDVADTVKVVKHLEKRLLEND
jgi:hypothetical protein